MNNDFIHAMGILGGHCASISRETVSKVGYSFGRLYLTAHFSLEEDGKAGVWDQVRLVADRGEEVYSGNRVGASVALMKFFASTISELALK